MCQLVIKSVQEVVLLCMMSWDLCFRDTHHGQTAKVCGRLWIITRNVAFSQSWIPCQSFEGISVSLMHKDRLDDYRHLSVRGYRSIHRVHIPSLLRTIWNVLCTSIFCLSNKVVYHMRNVLPHSTATCILQTKCLIIMCCEIYWTCFWLGIKLWRACPGISFHL